MRRTLLIATAGLVACSSRSEKPPPAAALTAIDPPAAAGAMAPNLHASSDGVLATWLEPAGDSAHRLRFARWSGAAWSAPVTIVEDARIVANWADVPSVARGADGALVAHWAQTSGDGPYAYDAVVARSTDGGATWKPLGPLHDDGTPTEHGFVSLVADAGGVRALWLDGRATGDGGAMTLRSAVVGDTIGDGTVVDAMVCDCCGTAATSTGAGPIVVYRDRTEGELRDIGAARLTTAGWSAVRVHADGWQIAGCPVNGPAVAARGMDTAVAWYTYAGSAHRVRVAFSRDGGASFGVPIDVDAPRGTRAPAGRVSVVLDDDGHAIVGWLASDREDGSILLRRVARDGRLGAELRIGDTGAGRDAGFPRLARDGDGVVAIWTEPGVRSKLRAVRVPLGSLPGGDVTVAGRDGEPREAIAPVGSAAPALELSALDGTPASLGELRGKVVLVNLWALWCEPCRHELPVLADLHEREAARGLAVVAINVDRKRPRDDIAGFVARQKLPFTIWLDPDDRASAALGAATYPVNLLVGRDGTIVWRRDGAIRRDDPELRAALDAALR